jgi:hypothetical protein
VPSGSPNSSRSEEVPLPGTVRADVEALACERSTGRNHAEDATSYRIAAKTA